MKYSFLNGGQSKQRKASCEVRPTLKFLDLVDQKKKVGKLTFRGLLMI